MGSTPPPRHRQESPPAERIEGTGTLHFIKKFQVPKDRKATYANFVCNIRPQKTERHRVRMTAGGDKLDYPGDASSPTVSMLDAKIHRTAPFPMPKMDRRTHYRRFSRSPWVDTFQTSASHVVMAFDMHWRFVDGFFGDNGVGGRGGFLT
jgi:hypothetical protein